MMSFTDQLHACHERLASVCAALPAPYPAFTLFFSVSDGSQRAHVVHARAADFETAWREGAERVEQWVRERGIVSPWLRIDWVEGASPMDWTQFKTQLTAVKRNYFRLGLAFDKDFALAFTEQELNANAMLSGDSTIAHSVVNPRNFEVYGQARFERTPPLDMAPDQPVYLLATVGVFCQPDGVVHKLVGTGLDAGRRQLPSLNPQSVLDLVRSGSSYLARQVQNDGLFVYGYFPCFDRRIPTYDAMRHASTLHAMLEAWELTRDETLRFAVERALDHLATALIRDYTLSDGRVVSFLVDTGGEIRLGGNAACVLALVKYCELMETRHWLPLLEKLALGIVSLQDPATGRFNHVLHASDLAVKQALRTIYYDGEAAFALMRLYGLTRDPQWLAVVEKAFDHFIASQHWQSHDHWLSCCVNELTHWSPQEKYFRFGLQNVAGYLDFVLDRKTTFPTLLELMLAAQQMLQRLEGMPAMRHLLDELDTEKFYRALDYRAHYLLNGFFWPETAMYFRRPSSVVGSFFVRHHSFRVRIDDVQQYVSGFAAYHRYLLERRALPGLNSVGGIAIGWRHGRARRRRSLDRQRDGTRHRRRMGGPARRRLARHRRGPALLHAQGPRGVRPPGAAFEDGAGRRHAQGRAAAGCRRAVHRPQAAPGQARARAQGGQRAAGRAGAGRPCARRVHGPRVRRAGQRRGERCNERCNERQCDGGGRRQRHRGRHARQRAHRVGRGGRARRQRQHALGHCMEHDLHAAPCRLLGARAGHLADARVGAAGAAFADGGDGAVGRVAEAPRPFGSRRAARCPLLPGHVPGRHGGAEPRHARVRDLCRSGRAAAAADAHLRRAPRGRRATARLRPRRGAGPGGGRALSAAAQCTGAPHGRQRHRRACRAAGLAPAAGRGGGTLCALRAAGWPRCAAHHSHRRRQLQADRRDLRRQPQLDARRAGAAVAGALRALRAAWRFLATCRSWAPPRSATTSTWRPSCWPRNPTACCCAGR
jgi:hypothetical protein